MDGKEKEREGKKIKPATFKDPSELKFVGEWVEGEAEKKSRADICRRQTPAILLIGR
jgi:hypothetical protein